MWPCRPCRGEFFEEAIVLDRERLRGPGGLEFFEETAGGEDGGGDDFFADDGVRDGADPGLFKKMKGDFQRPGQNVEHLLHCIVIGRLRGLLKGRTRGIEAAQCLLTGRANDKFQRHK